MGVCWLGRMSYVKTSLLSVPNMLSQQLGQTIMEQASKPTQAEKVLVSVESPYTASNWFRFQQHLQYGVLCNKHAASLGDATFAPHLCNT